MTERFIPPPIYEPDHTTWPALLHFQAEIAMALRRKNETLREEIADLRRRVEILRRLVSGDLNGRRR